MNSGQEKLNKNDVRSGIWSFILSFLVLSGFSFFCVYLFFESSRRQSLEIEKYTDEYRNMQKRDLVLQQNIEEIYTRMSFLSKANTSSNKANQEIIVTKIIESRKFIGKDSIKDLKHYSMLLKNMGVMMSLKERLYSLNQEVDNAKFYTEECQNKINRATTTLSDSGPKVGSRAR